MIFDDVSWSSSKTFSDTKFESWFRNLPPIGWAWFYWDSTGWRNSSKKHHPCFLTLALIRNSMNYSNWHPKSFGIQLSQFFSPLGPVLVMRTVPEEDFAFHKVRGFQVLHKLLIVTWKPPPTLANIPVRSPRSGCFSQFQECQNRCRNAVLQCFSILMVIATSLVPNGSWRDQPTKCQHRRTERRKHG